MSNLEVKDRVTNLQGVRDGHEWHVETVLNASGMYYAFVKLDTRVTITKDVETNEQAKNAGCSILSRWFADLEGG